MRSADCVRSFVVVLTGAILAGTGFAAAPRLNQLNPGGGQRGTELDVVFRGTNLADAEEVMFYSAGLEVLSLQVPEGNKGDQLRVRLKIAEDCQLGPQRIRVRTRTGLSDLKLFQVGALPVVDEKEPNTSLAQSQSIPRSVTVHGRIDREDVDYFTVEARKGERLSVEVVGLRNGLSQGADYFDPYLAIFGPDGQELARCDDAALVWSDAVLSLIAPADGPYVIELRDSAYNGDGNALYQLHLGQFPRPRSVVPLGGRPGETLSVTFLGDPAGPLTQEVTLPSEPVEQFGLFARDDGGTAPSWNWFRLSDLPNVVEQEPNNSRTEATPGQAPGACNGVLTEGDATDYFKFSAKKDQQFDIEVYARRLRSELDPVLAVYDAATGRQLAADDDARRPDSYLRFKAPADGEFAVAVRDHLGEGSDAHTYRVEIAPVIPRVLARPVEFSRYVQPQIIIPRGGAVGIVANVTRQDVSGAVVFRGENLPEGVSLECPEGWRKEANLPIVFYASPEAPLEGTYARLMTRIDDPALQPPVEGPLAQLNLLIRGRNNNRVWEEDEVRMPVVVTETAPFSVQIETPAVPLVHGGSLELKVVAERAEGFTAPIKLEVLLNPPGVSSSRTVSIPGDQREATITLNAAGNAPVQETMIAVRASATVGNGTVETCSRFVPLRVAAPYLQLEYQAAAVERGQSTQLLVKVKQVTPFEGEAEVQLLGLPSRTSTAPLRITKETQELVFEITAEEQAPEGTHKSLFCRVLIPESGTTILHNLGTGRLRIDRPLSTATPKVAAQSAPASKPVSRLEQLRKLQQEREAAQKSAPSGASNGAASGGAQ
jgi:hypothetical protein